MTTYNTGNPVPSTAVKDLYDNSQTEDEVVNSDALTTVTRTGKTIKTFAGFENDFQEFLLASGYEFLGDYDDPGELTFTRRNQMTSKDGEYWRPSASLVLPYTTVNNWVVDEPKFVGVGDASLRQALANGTSDLVDSGVVGYRGRHVDDRLDDQVFVTDYGALGDGVTNDTSAVMAAWTAATLQGKALTFPAGVYYGTWGNLANPDLTIRCLGKVELHNTGAGVALTLSAGANNWYNFRIEGQLVVSGNATSTNGVAIQGLHHSLIDIDVRDVPGVAVDIKFGVLTDYRIRVSPAGNPFTVTPTAGIVANIRNAGEYVADCRFYAIIEGVSDGGIDFVDVRGSTLEGTSEGNGTYGVREQVNCRRNTLTGVWCELNGGNDFIVRSDSLYINCHASSVAVTNNIEVEGRCAKFIGGYLRCVNLQGTSADTDFSGVETSDNVSLGIKGTGTHTRRNCVKSDNAGVITGRFTDINPGLPGSVAYDPPALVDGAGTSTTVTVSGAVLGDFAVASFNPSVAGLTVTADVTAADTVTVRLQNESGGALDLAAGTLRVKVFQ